jgi:hypothetical protein
MPLVRQAVSMREKELRFLVEHIDNVASLSRSSFDAYLVASSETKEQNLVDITYT